MGVRMSSREIALIGMMLGLSLLFDVMPIEMPTVWGMKIDLVAVPIIMVYLLTGFTGGLTAVLLLFAGLSVVSSASWLGAMMKSFATLAVIVGFEVAKRATGFELSTGGGKLVVFAVLAYLAGLAVRIPLMLALNYYVALEIWLGLPREQVVQAVESWTGVPFWVAIGLPNAIQSAIDVFLGLAATIPVLRRVPHLLE
ncbi:ECF transporter S component [Thermococcus cleftensis]